MGQWASLFCTAPRVIVLNTNLIKSLLCSQPWHCYWLSSGLTPSPGQGLQVPTLIIRSHFSSFTTSVFHAKALATSNVTAKISPLLSCHLLMMLHLPRVLFSCFHTYQIPMDSSWDILTRMEAPGGHGLPLRHRHISNIWNCLRYIVGAQ